MGCGVSCMPGVGSSYLSDIAHCHACGSRKTVYRYDVHHTMPTRNEFCPQGTITLLRYHRLMSSLALQFGIPYSETLLFSLMHAIDGRLAPDAGSMYDLSFPTDPDNSAQWLIARAALLFQICNSLF